MPTATTTRPRPRREDARRVAEEAAGEARNVASTAVQRGGELAEEVGEDARQLAGAVRERATELTGELATQGRSVMEETIEQVELQARGGLMQLANGFRELGEEAQALSEGRPEDAPRLQPYVYRAADGLYGVAEGLYTVADDIEHRGVGSVLEDLQLFARRRPGAFLLGAAVAGFGVGRIIRAQKAGPQARPEEDGERGDADATRRARSGAPARRRP